MKRNFMTRYLVFIAVLLVCAGAAWFWARAAAQPGSDAVLVWQQTTEEGEVNDER